MNLVCNEVVWKEFLTHARIVFLTTTDYIDYNADFQAKNYFYTWLQGTIL